MGYVMVTASCFGCKRIFSFNPVRVPSITFEGERRPVCRFCIEAVNPQRVKNGLEPVVPHPEAYEPCDESEVQW